MSVRSGLALRCPKCLADAGRYIGAEGGHPLGTYRCDECDHVWSVRDSRTSETPAADESPVTRPVHCKSCGATLTVHMDRWHADARLRQQYACPVCNKRDEGTFAGRVVRITRRWDTA